MGSPAADNRGQGDRISLAWCTYAVYVKYCVDGKLVQSLCLCMCVK